MSTDIKFIHTADLHLGRPVSSGRKPPAGLKKIFSNAGYKAWKQICKLAIDEEVEFILISGDLYDREARSVKASRIFTEQCKKLADEGIYVYVISGNHDPLGEAKEPFSAPENVHFFSSEKVENILHKAVRDEISDKKMTGSFPAAEIMGQSYRAKFESRKMYTYYTPDQDSHFNIGLLHTQLNPRNNRYVPISRQDLINKDDIDYWALGHIHEPRVLESSSPVISYPGIPQARTIEETGVKGCFLVELQSGSADNKCNINFMPTSPVIFARIEVDITENKFPGQSSHNHCEARPNSLQNLTDLQNLLNRKGEMFLQKDYRDRICFSGQEEIGACPSYGRKNLQGFVVRWLIKGRNSIHELISENQEEAEEELIRQLNNYFAARGQKPFLWTHSLHFRTNSELPDKEEISNNEIYQEIEAILADLRDNKNLRAELKDTWGEIWQGRLEKEERRNDRFYPDKETSEEILQAAHQQIIAHLFAGEN